MRNQEVNSRFALNPVDISIPRSKFDRPSSVLFSGNVGDIIPFYVDEVLPGDTFQIKTSKLVRLQTLVAPIMSNLYLDTYYFFVPNRLTWNHWKQFNGENTESKWIPQTTYSIPQLSPPEGGWQIGTIADYMGIPTGCTGFTVNALPFRAYALIMNEWFRDQNNLDYLDIPLGDATVQGVNSANFITDVAKGGKPYIASKYHDYFTSALPAPQKGNDVGIGLVGQAPVYSLSSLTPYSSEFPLYWRNSRSGSSYPSEVDGSPTTIVGVSAAGTTQGFYTPEGGLVQTSIPLQPSNLWADMSSASSVTVNALRLAFATQRMYEKDARGGELIYCLLVKKIAEKIWNAVMQIRGEGFLPAATHRN